MTNNNDTIYSHSLVVGVKDCKSYEVQHAIVAAGCGGFLNTGRFPLWKETKTTSTEIKQLGL